MTVESIISRTSIQHHHLDETINLMATQASSIVIEQVLPIRFSSIGMSKFSHKKIVTKIEILISEECQRDETFLAAVNAVSRLLNKKDKEELLNKVYPVRRLLFAKDCAENIVDDPFKYMN